MIAPFDLDYKDTKLVKQGKKILVSPIKEIVEWASSKYSVKFLNAFCDVVYVNHVNRPRLMMILEHESDLPKFKDGWNFDKKKQKQIEDAFRSILDSQKLKMLEIFKVGSAEVPHKSGEADELVGDLFTGKWSKVLDNLKSEDSSSQIPDKPIDTDKFFSVFTVFETVAKWEANGKIPKEKVASLQTQLNYDDLWLIRPSFTSATFFFYTDEQVKMRRTNGSFEQMRDAYFELLVPYDEFNYFDQKVFTISLDSKENFDEKYKSNWFYYDR